MEPWIFALIIIGVVVILGIVGLIVWFVIRGKKKFPFLLYSRDGRYRRTIHGHLKVDPENPKNKRFGFDENDSTLEIRPPTAWVNNQPIREIYVNDHGEYCYFKHTTIAPGGDVKFMLTPEERQISLHRLKENQRRYENPMNKAQAYMLITGFVLVLLLAIGIVYATIAYSSNLKEISEVTKSNLEVSKIQKSSIEAQQKVVEQLTIIAGALTGDANITRQVI